MFATLGMCSFDSVFFSEPNWLFDGALCLFIVTG